MRYGTYVTLVALSLATARVSGADPSNTAAPVPAPAASTISSQLVGAPVRSSRVWFTALAPNKRGGWNFITQSHEFKSGLPTEFVVIDLATGKATITEDATGVHGTTQVRNQLRAPNGRIFFPESDNYIAYYDPGDERVKSLGRVIAPPAADRTIYRMVFGPDGKLYGGTQSTGLPTVFQLDPDTLKVRIIGHVGKNRLTYSYAYYLAADPPWLYVAVGQDPWELVAINIETGVQRLLATRADNGFIQLDTRKDGITATLITGIHTPQAQREIVWCVDGKTYPFQPRLDRAHLPFQSRDVRPVANPLVDPPELDTAALDPDARGTGRIKWRHGDAWRETPFHLKYTAPIDIESLITLPDGTLLGNAKQYHGFFRYDPKRDAITAYGAHGPSQGARAIVDGIVYITGYPNGVLFAYDPKQPWTSTKALSEKRGPSNLNPRRLGNFTATGTKYAYFLVPSRNGRLYYAGRRERDGVGSGIGSYEISSGTFAGHNNGLSFFDPQGLLVLDDLKRVVFSGRLHDDPALPGKTPAEAALILYDYDLNEVSRLVVKPGLRNTGELFRRPGKDILIGIVRGESTTAMYRYDLTAKKLLDYKEVLGKTGASVQRGSDGSVWIVLDHALTRVDPDTLALRSLGRPDATGDAEHLTWLGSTLYFSVHDQLRRITVSK